MQVYRTPILTLDPNAQAGGGLVEVVKLADAQATVEALQAQLVTLKRHAELDCGDQSCLYALAHSGMRTNGGCRCSPKRTKDDLERSRKAVEALQQERDFFETAAATANRMRVDTERALRDERDRLREALERIEMWGKCLCVKEAKAALTPAGGGKDHDS